MQNEELEPAFRQTAELLDRLGTRLANDPPLNRPDPEIGRRYGDHLEATAQWSVNCSGRSARTSRNFSIRTSNRTTTGRLVLLTKPIHLSGNQPSQEVNTLCQPINTIRPTLPAATIPLKNKSTQLVP